jgi:WD40 repeat protein
VVGADDQGRVLLWNPARPRSPRELGSGGYWVEAMAVLSDGRVVSGGDEDGRVLLWDPTKSGSEPVELGIHDRKVWAVAALPDGRVVSAGRDGRVLLWDVTTRTRLAQLSCSATALAVGPPGRDETTLAIAHEGTGLSFWSIATRQTA